MLRIALAQVNATVGDLDGNANLIVEWTRRAAARGARLAVFPEMMLTGYPVEDLALRASFVDASISALHAVAGRLAAEGLGGVAVVAGYLARRTDLAPRTGLPVGAPLDAAALLYGGQVVITTAKHHLPNYGVFDEFRYFVPGDTLPVFRLPAFGGRRGPADQGSPADQGAPADQGGPAERLSPADGEAVDVAIAICEDLWQDGGPVAVTRRAGASLLVVPNASPYERGKDDLRLDLCVRRAREAGAALAYANMIGGQDELVFDGDSILVSADGDLLARGPQFEEALIVADLDLPAAGPASASPEPPVDAGDGTTITITRVTLPASGEISEMSGTGAPAEAEAEPTGAEPDPTRAEQEPAGAELAGAGQEPAGGGQELAGAQPAGAEQEPTGAGQKPAEAEQEPTGAGQEPTGAGQEPTEAEQEPTGGEPEPTGAEQGGPFWPRLSDPAEVYAALVTGVRDYVKKNGFRSVILGLSGGIDSALTATIAADAIGPENVHVVLMPSRYSTDHSISDAEDLVERQGLHGVTIPIKSIVDAFTDELGPAGFPSDGLPAENLQARARGMILMSLSNAAGHLVLTTGNKSELATGYSTLYGDSAGGFGPIKDVPKTLVWELARWRNAEAARNGETPPIPENSITKPPSAELAPGQMDTDSLPPYETLDALLDDYVEKDMGSAELIAAGHDPALVERVIRMVDAAEYKRRQYPPGPKISQKNFGRDRRLPITNCWREPRQN